MYLFISKNVISCWAWWKPYRAAYDFQGSFSRSHKTCKEIVNKTNFHTVVSFFQPKCMVYACFVAKMSKMAFTRFGGQFQFEKSMLGRLDNSGAGLMGLIKNWMCVCGAQRIIRKILGFTPHFLQQGRKVRKGWREVHMAAGRRVQVEL